MFNSKGKNEFYSIVIKIEFLNFRIKDNLYKLYRHIAHSKRVRVIIKYKY